MRLPPLIFLQLPDFLDSNFHVNTSISIIGEKIKCFGEKSMAFFREPVKI